MNIAEARNQWAADAAMLAEIGVSLPDVMSYIPDGFRRNFALAMDAQPALVSVSNAGIPAFLTTMIDPQLIKVLLAPNKAAEIFGEVRKGTWLDETAMFPVIERTGEVSAYGDYAENGSTGVNTNWPQRQSFFYQTIKQYGEREAERAGLARINWVSEINEAAVVVLNKYQNRTYFFGVSGLQNYGGLNDPSLSASLTPATKAAGGTKWILSGALNATANEIYADIEAIFFQLVAQTAGLIDREAKMTLAMSPVSDAALTATNSFNVNVSDLLKKNFPNLTVKTAVQYGQTSTSNPEGITAGNLVQLIVDSIEGQQTAFAAFNEKLRSHPIITAMSSWKQKMSQGTWGTVVRQPMGIASMVGV